MRELVGAALGLLLTFVLGSSAQARPTAHPESADAAESVLAPAASAPSGPATSAPAASIPAASAPFVPVSGAGEPRDWIMLVSGEWLKGSIKGLNRRKLIFDSDKLQDQSITWSKVKEIRSSKVHTYVLDDRSQLVGRATLADATLWVETPTGRVDVPRRRLMRIVRGEPSERNWWATKVSLGLTLNSGNTEQMTATGGFRLRREDGVTRGLVEYDLAYGRANGATNQNRHTCQVDFDIYLSPRLYVRPISARLGRDPFQNSDLRLLAFGGVGYEPIRNKVLDLDVALGLGYLYSDFTSVPPGTEDGLHEAAVSLSARAGFDIGDDIDLDFEWVTAFIPTDVGLTTHQGTGELDIDLTDALDFEVKLTYRRWEQPITRLDGTTPKQGDIQLTLGLSLDLGYD